jgi:hypothetical protein|tara:strand:- start:193 stop:411 length:219 start_codon:yes stop_codon:yes gene_type:complete
MWVKTTSLPDLQRPIVEKFGHLKPDFIHVRNKHDHRVTLPSSDPQIPGFVDSRFRPSGQVSLYDGTHTLLIS